IGFFGQFEHGAILKRGPFRSVFSILRPLAFRVNSLNLDFVGLTSLCAIPSKGRRHLFEIGAPPCPKENLPNRRYMAKTCVAKVHPNGSVHESSHFRSSALLRKSARLTNESKA